ncbi:urease accessory protein UreF [Cognatishimia maritima]|uniref:Urease accessory protein UreF n=1 Tax=Cognatishimia maritima TaxID=870908 RepID=A0A1M5K198_9RHOB|nr:urease accessory UreF family protein [Cognatishimia maritima]SHG46642.1 urease accessory protein [Cognatishimia maritima]
MNTAIRHMITVTTIAMPIDAKLLTLTQWLSPAFPVGAFAYSHGLEQAVCDGWIHDAYTLNEWLVDIARHGSGMSDAIWIRLAYAAQSDAELDALNAQCRAYAPCAERLREGQRQGQAFARVASEVWGLALPNLQLPVALGSAARQMGLSPDSTITLYLQSFLGNLVSAAQRLMPLGQTEAQTVLAQLNADCIALAQASDGKALEDITSSAFLSDIAAMRHETLQPRIFQS